MEVEVAVTEVFSVLNINILYFTKTSLHRINLQLDPGVGVLDLLGLGEHPRLLDEGDQVVVAGLQVPAPHHVAEDASPGGLVQLPGLWDQ